MAKRKRKSVRKTRGVGGGGGWKRSGAVALALIGLIGGLWIWIILYGMGGTSPATFHDYPYTFMTEEEGAKPIVIRADSDKQPHVPFKKDGKWYWETWECYEEDCPGRDGKKNYIFPMVIKWKKERIEAGKKPELTEEEMKKGIMPMDDIIDMETCPLCLEDGKNPPHHIERYETPEGRKIKDKRRKEMLEKLKNQ